MDDFRRKMDDLDGIDADARWDGIVGRDPGPEPAGGPGRARRVGAIVTAFAVFAAAAFLLGRLRSGTDSPPLTSPTPSLGLDGLQGVALIRCGVPVPTVSSDEIALDRHGVAIAYLEDPSHEQVVLRRAPQDGHGADYVWVPVLPDDPSDLQSMPLAPGVWGAACIDVPNDPTKLDRVLHRQEQAGAFVSFTITDPFGYWPELKPGGSGSTG